MGIRGEKMQTVLHGSGRDPDVVGRDGRAGLPKRVEDDSVPLGRVGIHAQDLDARRLKKPLKLALVLLPSLAPNEASEEFSKNNRIQANLISLLESCHDLGMASHKSRVPERTSNKPGIS